MILLGDYVNSIWNERVIRKVINIYTPNEWLIESPSDKLPPCNICAVQWRNNGLGMGYWIERHLIKVEENLRLWYGIYGR